MRHIPNVLSALRILMVGVFIYFFVQAQYLACLITYITAFLTDLLDGYLARRNNWISDIGKVLDPLADKLMLLTALMCFLTKGWLPLYMIVIVFAKELTMIIGGAILFRKNVVVYSDWFGKLASGFFNASVALTLAKRFFPQIGILDIIVLGIAIVLALIALVHYALIQLPHIRKTSAE
ncbi:CDP-alcohol phosphatidyltransferase family protein [bacterium]|nr:CDP-alcohol phosphatidyltransferase family protein [bacterium]